MKKHTLPLITAHAGCMNTPANSIENIETAINAGADIVEVDVTVTKDGVGILFHDDVLCTPSGKISLQKLTVKEIQTITAITRLEDALDLVRNHQTTLNLDIKTPDCLHITTTAVKTRDMVDTVLLTGCDKTLAPTVKQRYPEFQVLLNTDIRGADVDPAQYDAYMKDMCQTAVNASCCGLNMHYADCRQEILWYARLRSLPIFIYTVDNLDDMKKFFTWGVHSITTYNIPLLYNMKNSTTAKQVSD